jgi:hypothetical protein
VPHFAAIGHACPSFSNPADYLLGLINTDFDGHADVPFLVESCKEKQFPHVQPFPPREDAGAAAADMEAFSNLNPNPAVWHFIVLMHRNFLNTMRNPGVILIRLVMYFMLAVMIGGMFYQNGNKTTDKAIQGRLACLFFVFAFMVLDTCIHVDP